MNKQMHITHLNAQILNIRFESALCIFSILNHKDSRASGKNEKESKLRKGWNNEGIIQPQYISHFYTENINIRLGTLVSPTYTPTQVYRLTVYK